MSSEPQVRIELTTATSRRVRNSPRFARSQRENVAAPGSQETLIDAKPAVESVRKTSGLHVEHRAPSARWVYAHNANVATWTARFNGFYLRVRNASGRDLYSWQVRGENGLTQKKGASVLLDTAQRSAIHAASELSGAR